MLIVCSLCIGKPKTGLANSLSCKLWKEFFSLPINFVFWYRVFNLLNYISSFVVTDTVFTLSIVDSAAACMKKATFRKYCVFQLLQIQFGSWVKVKSQAYVSHMHFTDYKTENKKFRLQVFFIILCCICIQEVVGVDSLVCNTRELSNFILPFDKYK